MKLVPLEEVEKRAVHVHSPRKDHVNTQEGMSASQEVGSYLEPNQLSPYWTCQPPEQ